jgi:hypothetical protein
MSGQFHAPAALPPKYPLDSRLGGLQSWSGLYRHSNSDPSVIQPIASRYTDCAIAAPRTDSLSFPGGTFFFVTNSSAVAPLSLRPRDWISFVSTLKSGDWAGHKSCSPFTTVFHCYVLVIDPKQDTERARGCSSPQSTICIVTCISDL